MRLLAGWGTIDSCASSLSAKMREVQVVLRKMIYKYCNIFFRPVSLKTRLPVVSDEVCEASSSTEVTVSLKKSSQKLFHI